MFDPQADLTDAAIIQRVQSGEAELFAELVRRYQSPLMRVARSRLGREDWAEEVVQEAFMAAFKSCATYEPRFQFRTWLWTILLNQCHAHYQRRQRSVPIESWDTRHDADLEVAANGAGDSPLVRLLAAERDQQLESLLAQLSDVQADALRLRFFGGLKFHEIAKTMQCSLNTAKNRVRWGLMRMAEMIQTADAPGAPRSDVSQEPRQ